MRALLICVVAVSVAGCTFGVKTCSDTSECGDGATCQQGFCVAIGGETGGGNGQTGGGSGGGTATGGGIGTGGGQQDDAGFDAGVSCSTRAVACPLGFECRESLSGSPDCVVAFSGLTIVVADGGTLFNATALDIRIEVQRKPTFNVAALPASSRAEVTQPDGGVVASDIAESNGGFNGAFLTGADGLYSALARLELTNEDGGVESLVSPSVAFSIDRTAPSLIWQPLDAGYKRDDVVLLTVSSNEQLSEISATLQGHALTKEPSCSTDYVGCFRADFSVPVLNGISANWVLSASAVDMAGNHSDAGQVTAVTRVRWVQQVGVAGTAVLRAAPAIGPDGTIYVGTTDGSNQTTGVLARLDSSDGGIIASSSGYGGIVSVAVTNADTAISGGSTGTVVFVESNATRGELRGLGPDLTDMAGTLPTAAQANGTLKAWSGIVLVPTAANAVAAIATTASGSNVGSPANAGRLLKWDSVDGATFQNLPQNNVAVIGYTGSPLEPIAVGGSGATTAVPIVATNGVASVVSRQPNTLAAFPDAGLFLRRLTSIASTPALDSTTVTQLETSDSALTYGQCVAAGGSLVTTLTATRNVFYAFTAVSSGQPAGNVDYGSAVIHDDGVAFLGAGDAIVRINPTAPATLGVQVDSLPGTFLRTMPLLGAASLSGTPELGYAVANNGLLVAFDVATTIQPGAGRVWAGTVPGTSATTVETHPAFDCNRRNGAAVETTGIVYIPYLDGRVAAVVVDSPRLIDAPGSWPKYQRTVGNAGNTDAYFPVNWPCP